MGISLAAGGLYPVLLPGRAAVKHHWCTSHILRQGLSLTVGVFFCTPAPDQIGLGLFLPSCRDVGRMNLIRYSSIQTPHRCSITVISASSNAQRDKITEGMGMLLLFLTLYFSFITWVRAFVPNTIQAAFEISNVTASSWTSLFPFFFM